MNCRTFCCHINLRIAIAVIGVLVGILAGVWFAGDYKNYNAAVFGFISAIFALITLIVHIKYKRNTLNGWAQNKVLFSFMILGCIFQVIAVAVFIADIVIGIVKHQGLSSRQDMMGENCWIALVWAWMTWKWSFALFWFSRKYRLEILREISACQSIEAAVEEIKVGRTPHDVYVSTDGTSRE